ncbi:restriction endonuclease subunit S [Rhodoferax sp. TBRC 17198]|uniref:restriction endonuclease subunit S n=1 Tax=Rhodoferax potami TaxID=3068338 RepID=UPI0028BE1816|nr:restriction endonuclease subunit S [Rhodoferax sp. TBRC 17198]MDT7523986.1 restriction endonuclease subunit S [Rhodoferax sp. TBRC 17198]
MLLSNLNLLATSPGGVARLRELILTLAVQGKLVPQDSSELSADTSRITSAVERLIEEGKVPRSRTLERVELTEDIDCLPNGWISIVGSNVFVPRSGNSKLIKGKLFSEPADHLFPGFSASGQDVWLADFEYEGTALVLSAVGARCGKAFLATGKWSSIANTHIIWPVLDVVMPEYAMLLLNNESYWIRSGGAQPFVKVTETLQRAVCLPPLTEQSRIVTRVEELMHLCDALEAKGQLEATQHAQLVSTLLATLTESETPTQLADNWQRIATHFDLLLDRPEAVDALEQNILQLAVRGLLVPQDPQDEPASELLKKIRAEKDKLIAEGKIKRDKLLPSIAEHEQLFMLPTGWEWVRLGDVSKVISGYAFSSEDFSAESGIRAIKITNAGVGEFHVTDDYLPPSFAEGFNSFKAAKHDLILALTRPYVSDGLKISRCPTSYEGALINQRVAAIRCGSSIDCEFAFAYMQLPEVLSIYQNRFNGSGLQPNLKVSDVTELALPLPPIAEQSRIVTRVAQLRRLCAELRQRLAASQSTQAQLAQALTDEVAAT